MRCIYNDFSTWLGCAYVNVQAFLFIIAIIFAVVVGGFLIMSAQQRYTKYRVKFKKEKQRLND